MVALGLVVRGGSTPVDDWFQHGSSVPGRLLFFTDYRTMLLAVAVALGFALYRQRWTLAAVVAVTPVAAVWLSRLCKQLFGRQKEGTVAYPSGHTTVMVTVLGMLILVLGARLWVVLAAGAAGHGRAGRDVSLLHRHRRRAAARLVGGVHRGGRRAPGAARVVH